VQHLLCQTGFGGMSHEQNLASMRRFGEEVMPAFRRYHYPTLPALRVVITSASQAAAKVIDCGSGGRHCGRLPRLYPRLYACEACNDASSLIVDGSRSVSVSISLGYRARGPTGLMRRVVIYVTGLTHGYG
jgi:hypothetical protein